METSAPSHPLDHKETDSERQDQSALGNGTSYDAQSRSKPITVALMGATGTGKSTFINLLSDSKVAVGEGLKSCTSTVQISSEFEISGVTFRLVDTPGFDDTHVSDADILEMIAKYLTDEYRKGLKLNGIIYMHRITDPRMGGISRRNFNMFRQLCGSDALQNVVIVTNMWKQVSQERGEAREEELRGPDFFKPVLDAGAKMVRHDDTCEGARRILEHFLPVESRALLIQEEIVDLKKTIPETSAYVELDRELAEIQEKHARELETVQNELAQARAANDPCTTRELEEACAQLKQDIERIKDGRSKLSREYDVGATTNIDGSAGTGEYDHMADAPSKRRVRRNKFLESLLRIGRQPSYLVLHFRHHLMRSEQQKH